MDRDLATEGAGSRYDARHPETLLGNSGLAGGFVRQMRARRALLLFLLLAAGAASILVWNIHLVDWKPLTLRHSTQAPPQLRAASVPNPAKLAVAVSPSPSPRASLDLTEKGASILHNGSWALRKGAGGEFRLAAPHVLRRLTSGRDAAGMCLLRKDVLFLGDDGMRSLALALALVLDSGLPPDGVNAAGEERLANPLRQEYWECGDGFACDIVSSEQLLNVYYRSRYYGVNLTTLGMREFGGAGHFPMGTAAIMKWESTHPGFDSKYGWRRASMVAMADLIARHLPPQHLLFVNAGLFPLVEFATVDSAVKQLRTLEGVMQPGQKPIWLTSTIDASPQQDLTTARLKDMGEMEIGTHAALQLGWRVFDRRAMSKALLLAVKRKKWEAIPGGYVTEYWLQPYAVTEMLNVLLNMVCD